MVKTTIKNITLSNFRTEIYDLLNEVSQKIAANATRTLNFDMHDNYKIDIQEIENRLNGIALKFRKCEINYYQYFDDLHHDILTGNTWDLPISRQRIFSDGTAKTKQLFEVDDQILYQELINVQFQEFILFIASVIENLVYLAETLVRKVVVHLKGKHPPSIIMQNYIATLALLIKLDYRTNDSISQCLDNHKTFFEKYLPTINSYRNSFIHGYKSRLTVVGSEYMLETPSAPIFPNTLDTRVDGFTQSVLENMSLIIPDFLKAITLTVKTGNFVPA